MALIAEDKIFGKTGRVGVYTKGSDYGLVHLGTRIPFPLVFEHPLYAQRAAQAVDQIVDWDEYVSDVQKDVPRVDHNGLLMQMELIADGMHGHRLRGQPLDHQRIALLKRGQHEILDEIES